MGIPQFFGWITRKYDNIIECKTNEIDHLYFDFNCLIYHVYGDIIKNEYQKFSKYNEEQRVQYLLDEIEKYVVKIVKEVKPKKSVNVCIDGVVPMAKMHRQRQRRYKSPIFKEWENEIKRRFDVYQEELFDTNQITPGTPFMEKLGEKVKKIKVGVQYLVSDANLSGEGEHKIMRLLKKIPKKEKVCIYGLDADLIMLSLLMENEICLLRENVQMNLKDKFGENEFLVVDINRLKNSIYEEMMKNLSEKFNVKSFQFTKNRVVNDYIFLGFFLGNDFLHHIPSLSIANNGTDFLLKIYATCFSMCKNYLTFKVNGITKINKTFFYKLFEALSKMEYGNIKYIHQKRKVPNPPTFDDTYTEMKWKWDRIPFNDKFKDRFSVIDYLRDGWKKKYYEVFFSIDIQNKNDQCILNNICQNYIEGIIFTMRYYFDGKDYWEWYNPYFVSPLASDIFKYLDKIKDINVVCLDEKEPFTPYEQLLLVLPPSSFHHLPKSLQEEYKNPKLSLYYPKEFDWCCEEKFMLYSIEPKLPLFDIPAIREVCKEKKFTEKEMKRNIQSQLFLSK